MFQRNALSELHNWKNKLNRKPLIIRGARQVGKTTLVNEFSKEFDTFLHLNLEKSAAKELFDKNDAIEDVLTAIYLFLNKSRIAGSILLFIDEIQNSPRAVSLLRYFYEELPQVYVIGAGSLLESLIDRQIHFPVGRVEYFALRPCSFCEFLGALGENELKKTIEATTLPSSIHGRAMKLFNEYVLVGGMPEAVAFYALTKDLVSLNSIYETLLTGYRDDTEKYALNRTSEHVIRHVLTYGWQYAGQRIKYEKFANSNYKSREVSEAMQTLEKALLLELSYPTTTSAVPIQPDLKKSPKLLWLDTGLVNYSAGLQKELFGIKDISESWKGKIAEHVVGQELLSPSTKVSEKRFFWVREAKNSQAEIDFIFQYEDQLIPIEVKSGNCLTLKSLHSFMESSTHNLAIRFWNNPVSKDLITLPSGKKYSLYNLPFYYAGQLEVFMKQNHD